MTHRQLDRRALLSVGAIGVAASALGLRAGFAYEDHGTPEASPGASPMASLGASPMASPSAAGDHVVEMTDKLQGLQFDPDHLTIRVGDTVTWRNVSATSHTSTCDPEKANNPEEHVQLPEGAETWDSGLLNTDEEFSHTFEVAGEYTYFCIPHEANGMVANLTVEE